MNQNVLNGLSEIIELVRTHINDAFDDSWVDWDGYYDEPDYQTEVDDFFTKAKDETFDISEALKFLEELIAK